MIKNLIENIRRFFHIYVGINSAVAVLIISALLYELIFREFLEYLLGEISKGYDSNSLLHSILAGTVSSIIGALVFGLVGVFLLGWYKNIILTGNYKAYIKNNSGGYDEWGEVLISYHPLSTNSIHTPVKLRLKFNQMVLSGEGLIINNKLLIGHYYEASNPARFRSGSFTYELNGEGDTWSGIYNYVDPNESKPIIGDAKWIRK